MHSLVRPIQMISKLSNLFEIVLLRTMDEIFGMDRAFQQTVFISIQIIFVLISILVLWLEVIWRFFFRNIFWCIQKKFKQMKGHAK